LAFDCWLGLAFDDRTSHPARDVSANFSPLKQARIQRQEVTVIVSVHNRSVNGPAQARHGEYARGRPSFTPGRRGDDVESLLLEPLIMNYCDEVVYSPGIAAPHQCHPPGCSR